MLSQTADCSNDTLTSSSLNKGSLAVAHPNDVVAEAFAAEVHFPGIAVLLKPQAIGCHKGEKIAFDVFCFPKHLMLCDFDEVCLPMNCADKIGVLKAERPDSNP